MNKTISRMTSVIPGLAVAIIIAIIARLIEGLLPIHLIGASVIALFIGMILNSFWRPTFFKPGLKFTSKKS